MMVNRYLPHVFVLPEDDANHQLAIGFLLDPSLSPRQIQVLPAVGGWTQVFERLRSDHVVDMDRHLNRFMVLLIDCDGDEQRPQNARARIPQHLTERVFILGTLSNPEDLRRAGLGSYETIGLAMARDCREDTATIWGHDLLRHNAHELERLRQRIWPILFPPI
jgi:hypothetical protein